MSLRPRLPQVLQEEPQYRLLFTSQVLSILGDRITQIALPFAVLGIGGGVRDVALVSAAQFLPYLALALPAGVWADRWKRKGILIASDAIRMLCQLVAAGLLFGGHATVVNLAVVAAVYGAADAFFAPAFSGLLPTTVAPANLQAANALRGLNFSFAGVAGPVLAGVLIAVVGPGGALAFDAVTFAVSLLLLIPLSDAPIATAMERQEGATSESFWESLVHGWGEVRSRSWVWGFMLGSVSYHLVVLPAIFVLGPVLMEQELDGARSWATVITCFGVGAVVGDLVFLRWRPTYPMRVASLLLVGASLQALFIGSGLTLWLIGGLEFFAAICVVGAFTLWETSLGEQIPPTSLSRVSSYDYLTSRGMIPLGNVLAGFLAAAVSLQVMLFAMSAVGVAVAAFVAALPSVRRLTPPTRAPARRASWHVSDAADPASD